MRYCGISEYFHDAGIAFITEHGDIEFAAHAERYSKIKLDCNIHDDLLNMIRNDDYTIFYEDINDLKYRVEHLKTILSLNKRGVIPNGFDYNTSVNHHISHAAGAFYTRPWQSKIDTVIMTIDGQGQQQTMGIYDYKFNLLEKELIPKSIGILYGRITEILGLTPMQDEYIVMGLSSYGEPTIYEKFLKIYDDAKYIDKYKTPIEFNKSNTNRLGLIRAACKNETHENIAASIQKLAEVKILEWAKKARKYGSKLVYAGGVAENIMANTLIKPLFDDMWIPSAPGDAGSALGAAAYIYGTHTGKDHINWSDSYLGYNIERQINPRKVVDHLLNHTYCGIANGRAEFGPRALGNRSLIADVRYDVKDTVNKIKRRQKYRPFAPAIMEEFADQYFEGAMSEHMKYTAKALHDYKSVIHVDGTSRVQIVKKDCKSIIRPILEEYYERTGVPMLLNTSLNIRGMPMVNDEKDAETWEREYKVKVF
jgi:carbamoyltransferase